MGGTDANRFDGCYSNNCRQLGVSSVTGIFAACSGGHEHVRFRQRFSSQILASSAAAAAIGGRLVRAKPARKRSDLRWSESVRLHGPTIACLCQMQIGSTRGTRERSSDSASSKQIRHRPKNICNYENSKRLKNNRRSTSSTLCFPMACTRIHDSRQIVNTCCVKNRWPTASPIARR